MLDHEAKQPRLLGFGVDDVALWQSRAPDFGRLIHAAQALDADVGGLQIRGQRGSSWCSALTRADACRVA